MKEMYLETDFILFVVTAIVSLLHTIFEFLAVKHEIQFWKNVKSHKGLSLRTLNYSFFVSVIIFLYLLDNETSWMILMSTGVGIGVSFWKIVKTSKLTFKKTYPYYET